MSPNMSIAGLGLRLRFTHSRDWTPILRLQGSWTAPLFHEMKKQEAESRAFEGASETKFHTVLTPNNCRAVGLGSFS